MTRGASEWADGWEPYSEFAGKGLLEARDAPLRQKDATANRSFPRTLAALTRKRVASRFADAPRAF